MLKAVDLPVSEKELKAITRRRLMEAQRKVRIFDPRKRTIGVDLRGLEQQVHERQLQEDLDRKRELAIAKQLIEYDEHATQLEKQKNETLRNLHKSIDNFRYNYQQPEDRREFDIYDPNRLKKDRPTRLSDDDPNCSVSGVQRLVGEDLGHRERCKKQREQMSEWLKQQMEEKRMNIQNYEDEKKRLEGMLLKIDNQATRLDLDEKETRRRMQVNLKEYNQRLADEQKSLREQQNMADEIEKMHDIYNNFYGDMLTENPAAARSIFGPHRIVPDRWKGMSAKQLEEYYKGQRDQIVENMHKKERDLKNKLTWDHLILSQARQGILLDREMERHRRALNQQVYQNNQDLAQEHKAKQKYINTIVYTNQPTDDYFEQFNTTTR